MEKLFCTFSKRTFPTLGLRVCTTSRESKAVSKQHHCCRPDRAQSCLYSSSVPSRVSALSVSKNYFSPTSCQLLLGYNIQLRDSIWKYYYQRDQLEHRS